MTLFQSSDVPDLQIVQISAGARQTDLICIQCIQNCPDVWLAKNSHGLGVAGARSTRGAFRGGQAELPGSIGLISLTGHQPFVDKPAQNHLRTDAPSASIIPKIVVVSFYISLRESR